MEEICERVLHETLEIAHARVLQVGCEARRGFLCEPQAGLVALAKGVSVGGNRDDVVDLRRHVGRHTKTPDSVFESGRSRPFPEQVFYFGESQFVKFSAKVVQELIHPLSHTSDVGSGSFVFAGAQKFLCKR